MTGEIVVAGLAEPVRFHAPGAHQAPPEHMQALILCMDALVAAGAREIPVSVRDVWLIDYFTALAQGQELLPLWALLERDPAYGREPRKIRTWDDVPIVVLG